MRAIKVTFGIDYKFKLVFYCYFFMVCFKIYRQYADYIVCDNLENVVMKARNISKFLGPEQFVFFNERNEEFAKYKCSLFLSIGFNHRLIFNTNQIVRFQGKFRGISFDYRGRKHYIAHKGLDSNKLFIDGKEVGQTEVIKSGVSEFVHSVCCEDTDTCFIFSIADIVLNNFDVN